MNENSFYINNNMSAPLEQMIKQCDNYDEFARKFPDELLDEDMRIGQYLDMLIRKYDKKYSTVSLDAWLSESYVGNIVNGRRNTPARDAIICICFAIGTTQEELQYLLKYAGHAPLYVRRKRDVIIWYGIMKGERLEVVNDNLIRYGLTPLYKE